MEATLHHFLAAWMQFVLDYGYFGVFILMVLESTAFPMPAEIVIPPAAYWAAQGRMNVWVVVLAATFGSWVGSAISYWVALKVGRPLVEKYGAYVLMPPNKIHKADQWFEAYGAGGIFVARLLPGIRHLISLPAGLFGMDFKKFSLMTVLGAGLFNGALAWFGIRVIGDQPDLMKDPGVLMTVLKTKSHWLIAFALVVAALYVLMTWMQKRAEARRA